MIFSRQFDKLSTKKTCLETLQLCRPAVRIVHPEQLNCLSRYQASSTGLKSLRNLQYLSELEEMALLS